MNDVRDNEKDEQVTEVQPKPQKNHELNREVFQVEIW